MDIPYLFCYRQFPGHLLCKRDPESLPLEPPKGLDEDDPASSDHSMELLSRPFRTDRSVPRALSAAAPLPSIPDQSPAECILTMVMASKPSAFFFNCFGC